MAVFNEPTKWQTSLVNTGDANVIPQSTPVGTGEASFDDGFPQITQIPIGAGGIAPDRKDFNGLFKILGDWIFFNQNGGVSTYSENFDYVAGRVVSYNDNIYLCIQDNSALNKHAPTDTEYWLRFALNNELADYLPLAGGNVTGNLSVQNKNLVRSVNGVSADTSGNVTITADSTVSLKGTRTSNGTWTITGLTPYKPLYVINSSKTGASCACGIRATSGTNDTSGSDCWIGALGGGNGDRMTNVFIVIPTSTNVVLVVSSADDDDRLRAYQ